MYIISWFDHAFHDPFGPQIDAYLCNYTVRWGTKWGTKIIDLPSSLSQGMLPLAARNKIDPDSE